MLGLGAIVAAFDCGRAVADERANYFNDPFVQVTHKEIIPRVKKAILVNGRFADTSVWAEGQRRWVWLKGCVRSKGQAAALERLVHEIDDVEAVIDEPVVRGR